MRPVRTTSTGDGDGYGYGNGYGSGEGLSFSGSGKINPASVDIGDISDATSRGIF